MAQSHGADRRVLVVGSESRELAIAASRTGAIVVVVGCDPDAAGALAADVEAAGGRPAVFTGDVTRESGRDALTELLDELFSARRVDPG